MTMRTLIMIIQLTIIVKINSKNNHIRNINDDEDEENGDGSYDDGNYDDNDNDDEEGEEEDAADYNENKEDVDGDGEEDDHDTETITMMTRKLMRLIFPMILNHYWFDTYVGSAGGGPAFSPSRPLTGGVISTCWTVGGHSRHGR